MSPPKPGPGLGRLVGDDQQRVGHQRPRDRHALLLARRSARSGNARSGPTGRPAPASARRGPRRERATDGSAAAAARRSRTRSTPHQVVELEHEADVRPARRPARFAEPRDVPRLLPAVGRHRACRFRRSGSISVVFPEPDGPDQRDKIAGFRSIRFTSISTGTCCAPAGSSSTGCRICTSAAPAGRPCVRPTSAVAPAGCSTSGLQRGHAAPSARSLGAADHHPGSGRHAIDAPPGHRYARRCEPRSVPHVRARRPASPTGPRTRNSCPRVSRGLGPRPRGPGRVRRTSKAVTGRQPWHSCRAAHGSLSSNAPGRPRWPAAVTSGNDPADVSAPGEARGTRRAGSRPLACG